MPDGMESKDRRALRREYVRRINNVIDYIERHLEEDLNLNDLARVANFSKFHFHRIFRAMVGETINRFVRRLRLERAAGQLIYNQEKTITAVALDCGFSGSAVFARAFREAFGSSPTDWRSGGRAMESKIGKTNSKPGIPVGNTSQDLESFSFYIDPVTRIFTWRIKMKEKNEFEVEIKERPEMPGGLCPPYRPLQGG